MKRQLFILKVLVIFFLFVLINAGNSAVAAPPSLAGCPILPADNIWNTPVDGLTVSPSSAAYIASIGPDTGLHPDFGSGTWDGAPIGIPYMVVGTGQPGVAIDFEYWDESDPGPYPIPPDPAIEGGNQSTGDRHILVLDKDACILYELYSAYPSGDGSWQAGSGAVYDLRSNVLRPAGWTSADAAGLPILPGLARYDEVATGEIDHALRFTVKNTRNAYIWPARHLASSKTSSSYPPMGQCFRLKAGFDISGFSPQTQVILRALKKYGMILADNGSNWYISGVPDSHWDDDHLVPELSRVKGSNFEAVDESPLMVSQDSGQALSGASPAPPPLTLTPVASPTDALSQTIGGTTDAGASVTIATDTSASDGQASLTGNNWSYTITGLAAGPNNITVTARDSLGTSSVRTASISRRPGVTVMLTGSGAGTITSSPAGISCAGTCSASFDFNSAITLTATPAPGSLFTGWGNACNGSASTCALTMSNDRLATASFNYFQPVRIQGSAGYFPDIHSAYQALTASSTIQVRQLEFREDLNIDGTEAVTLKGGYDPGYTLNSGYTTIRGVLTIQGESLTVERLAIR